MLARRPKTPSVPSETQAHVLGLASRQGADIWWVPLVDGKGSQSRTVGRSLTIEACQRHGWLDRDGNLLQAGREAYARWEARFERRRKREGW
jgi:hypothetical protein